MMTSKLKGLRDHLSFLSSESLLQLSTAVSSSEAKRRGALSKHEVRARFISAVTRTVTVLKGPAASECSVGWRHGRPQGTSVTPTKREGPLREPPASQPIQQRLRLGPFYTAEFYTVEFYTMYHLKKVSLCLAAKEV